MEGYIKLANNNVYVSLGPQRLVSWCKQLDTFG